MSERREVKPGVFVRRLTFREFGRVQSASKAGQEAGDTPEIAFTCAIAAACAVTEDGSAIWADYEAVANDERPMLVAEVASAATEINGLGDEADSGNA